MGKPRRQLSRATVHSTANIVGMLGTGSGYSAEAAWKIAMAPNGSKSVVDLEGGGYAVPLERTKEIAPPCRTIPILARVPSGKVSLLPGRFGAWRIVAG